MMALSTDLHWLATVVGDSEVVLTSVGNVPRALPAKDLSARTALLRFSQNAKELAVGDEDGAVVVWDVKSATLLLETGSAGQPITAMEFARADDILFVGYADGVVSGFYVSVRSQAERVQRMRMCLKGSR
jgi:WD40 repeat protein